jgi:esterase
MALDVVQMQDTLGIAQTLLLGHSLGGKIAMALALTAGDRVPALIVGDIAPVSGRWASAQAVVTAASELPTPITRKQCDYELLKSIPDLATRQFIMQNLTAADSSVSPHTMKWRVNLPVIKSAFQNGDFDFDFEQAFIEYGPCTAPALFVAGGRSEYIRDTDHVLIEKYFPNARIETIKDAGHWVHSEKPAEFAVLINAFLREHSM